LCNVESDKKQPSQSLLDRYRELWGIDLYVLAWSLHGDVSQLPKPLQAAAKALSDRWKCHIDELLRQHKAEA